MDTTNLDRLIDKLEGRAPSDRLAVMAQNPANNHHWSLSLGMVTADELLRALIFVRAAMTAIPHLTTPATIQEER